VASGAAGPSRADAGSREEPEAVSAKALRAERHSAARAAAPASALEEDVARRFAAGELSEARRRPGACVVERVAWIDSIRSRIHRVSERREGDVVVERWYDDRGRQRAARASGPGFELRAAWDESGRESGRTAGGAPPAGAERAIAPLDPSEAFFGPPRCEAAP
jgi:hypothetical protein